MIPYNKFLPIQFGDFIFASINNDVTDITPIANSGDRSQFVDGEIRNNNLSPNTLEANTITFNFGFRVDQDQHKLRKLFKYGVQKLYFLEKFLYVPFQGVTSDGKDDYRIFFCYAEIVTLPEFKFSDLEGGLNYDFYSITFKIVGNPVKMLCQGTDLLFIEKDNFKLLQNNNFQKNDYDFQDNSFNFASINGAVEFNSLTASQRRAKMTKYCLETKGYFFYYDRFIKMETPLINEKPTNKFFKVQLSEDDGVDTPLYTTTNNLNIATSALNVFCVIQIENRDSEDDLNDFCMETNEFIIIENLSTKTKLKLTCLKQDRCPKILSIFSHKANYLFNGITNQPIDFINPNSIFYNAFKIENLSENPFLFAFSDKLPINEHIQTNSTDELAISHSVVTGDRKTIITFASLSCFY
jgi:hypothetical protein